ncbi:MAG: hypothetical protein A3G75_02760 [Verrucomicrobia bacterium RIFCSPLOWO2_12_FULL_64_8]|nr:MAG: hypothetical protein A3G75_02760 [Verrucomicrobia bacterium RIFCSPLOWO2_12_FULL_64_8]
MFRLRSVLSVLALAGLAAPAARPAEPPGARSGRWAHEGSSLAPDPRVVWGRLDNGFRYALRPHAGVPGRVSLRFVVLSGSSDELPEEHGIAHFTEHLAFHGSRDFPEDDMLALFRRLGFEYGSDVNAVTTFDYTSFRLDFRQNDLGAIREGLRFFRGIGDGLNFDPAAIDRERRVILCEMRTRDTLADRQQQAALPVIFRGVDFVNRAPIGTEESLRAIGRDQFLRFYRRCYRPDLMVLVAAGEIDPAAFADIIRQAFGSMVRPPEPIAPRSEGRLEARSLRAGIFRINGIGSVEALVASAVDTSSRPDTREATIERQRREFVMQLFAQRLRTRIPNAGGADASHQTLVRQEAAIASVQVQGENWPHGILALDQLVRNTLRNGFDPAEIENLRRQRLRLTAYLAGQIPVEDPGDLCDGLADSITGNTVYLEPEREYAWMREWLEKLTPAEVQKTFRGLWNPDAMAFNLAGDVDFKLQPAEIIARVQKQRRGGLDYLPPRLENQTVFKLPRWGAPTDVVERKEVPGLDARLMRFGNNVRLNFVASQHEPGLVRAVVRIGTGLLEMPGNKPALKEFGLNTLLGSGSTHFRPADLEHFVQERLLDFGFDVADNDAFTFRGMMGVENLDTFLGIIADFLSAPYFNSEAHKSERIRAAMSRSSSSVGFQEGLRDLMNHLFKGDARFMSGTPLDYISLSVVDVRRWMEAAMARGYVEVTIVGDLSEETAVRSISRTLGSLGQREAAKKTARPPRPVKVTVPAGFKRIEFVGEHNLGLAVGMWPVETPVIGRDRTALAVLTKSLELRVRGEVRDRLGLAYAPTSTFSPYEGFQGFAMLQAMVDCAPTEAERVAQIIGQVGVKLGAEGISEDELIGARGIIAGQTRQAFNDNGYLLSLLMRAQEQPDTVAEAIALHDGQADTITLAEVNAWAKKVLPDSNTYTAALVPKAFIGIFDSPTR